MSILLIAPKGKKASTWQQTGEHIVKGKVENHFATSMETPKTTVLQVYTAYIPFSVKNQVMLDAAKYVLDMIYVATLREEEGGTYGASVMNGFQKHPEERAMIQVYFNTNPESAMKLSELAKEGLEKLMNEGPTEEQLGRTVENFKKNIPESRITNEWWLSNLQFYYNYNGSDFDKEYEQAVEQIDAENIKAILKSVLEQGNLVEIMMAPQE